MAHDNLAAHADTSPSNGPLPTFHWAASGSWCSCSDSGIRDGSFRKARQREGKQASAQQLMWVGSHLVAAAW